MNYFSTFLICLFATACYGQGPDQDTLWLRYYFQNPDREEQAAIEHGLALGIEQINEEGGLEGRFLALSFRQISSKSEALQKIEQVDSAISIFILGHEVALIQTLLPSIEARKGLLFSPTCDVPLLRGGSPSFIRNLPPYDQEAEAAAAFAVNYLGLHKAAILYSYNEHDLALENEFAHAFYLRGGTVVAAELLSDATETINREYWEAVEKESAELIYLAGTKKDLIKTYPRVKALFPELPIIASSSFGLIETPATLIQGKDSLWVMNHASFKEQNKTSSFDQHFEEAYQRQFGNTPAWQAWQAYKIIFLLQQAVRSVGWNQEALLAYFQQMKPQSNSLDSGYLKDGEWRTPFKYQLINRDGVYDFKQ